MKKYKPNYMLTIMFQICNMYLSFVPGIFLFWLFANPNEAGGAWGIFPVTFAIILFFTIFGNLIHFIISIFTKHKVFIDEDSITIKGKKILTQSMRFEEVAHVVFDQGTISKVGGGEPCSITLFKLGYVESITITNPSFFTICEIQKRVRHVKIKFNNYKWYIIWTCISFFGMLFLAMFCR